jgi:hypothetical protein
MDVTVVALVFLEGHPKMANIRSPSNLIDGQVLKKISKAEVGATEESRKISLSTGQGFRFVTLAILYRDGLERHFF